MTEIINILTTELNIELNIELRNELYMGPNSFLGGLNSDLHCKLDRELYMGLRNEFKNDLMRELGKDIIWK